LARSWPRSRSSQSAVFAHLKILAEVGFVLAEHRGTAT